jgi:TctA family transporter
MIFGIEPGPQLLTSELDLVFVIIWSLALANVVGALLCLLLAQPIARLTFLPFHQIAPVILVVIVVGAWQETHHWADLVFLLGFGLLGWIMKRSGMPRPPLLIGFILSALAERYLWMSYNLYDWEWLHRPGVLIIGGLTVAFVVGGSRLKQGAVSPTLPSTPGKEVA